jgi:hypothetical protein
MIPKEVHAYMAESNAILADLEMEADTLQNAYIQERSQLENGGTYRMSNKDRNNIGLWLRLAVKVRKSGMDPHAWMNSAFHVYRPYPYPSQLLTADKSPKFAGVEVNAQEQASLLVSIQLQDFYHLLEKMQRPAIEILMLMRDRFDALFCWCILRRLGEDASMYRDSARNVTLKNQHLTRAYQERFPEEVAALL